MTPFAHDPVSRKRTLLLEFDHSIAPLKLQLSHTLPQLWKTSYEPPPASSLAPESRPPFIATSSLISQPSGPSSAKRGKIVDPKAAAEEDLWKACMAIHSRICRRKEAPPFQIPVDPVALKIPSYPDIIKNPMDLRTVKEKLQQRLYKTPMDFAADMRLIWHNCRTFNQNEGDSVRRWGDILSDVWEKAWLDSDIEGRWSRMLANQDPKLQAGIAMEGTLNELGGQLRSLVGVAPALPATSAVGREMTFVEKRKLSVAIGDLPAPELQVVLDIILDDKPSSLDPSTEDEVEVDMDSLSNSTLWRLHSMVSQFTTAGAKPAKSKPVGGAPDKMAQRPAGPSLSHPAASAPASANGDTPAESAGCRPTDTDSDQRSPRDVRCSTAGGPQGQSVFVRDRQLVGESASNPVDGPTFVKDKSERKTDVTINTANWSTLAAETDATAAASIPKEGEVGGGADGEGDEMWERFQSIAEQKAIREEEQKKREEQQRIEQEKVEAERKAAVQKLHKEEEERQKALREEEERQQAEQKKAREEMLAKELEEIKAKENTANLTPLMVSQIAVQEDDRKNGLEAVGLTYKIEEEESFDFDDV